MKAVAPMIRGIAFAAMASLVGGAPAWAATTSGSNAATAGSTKSLKARMYSASPEPAASGTLTFNEGELRL